MRLKYLRAQVCRLVPPVIQLCGWRCQRQARGWIHIAHRTWALQFLRYKKGPMLPPEPRPLTPCSPLFSGSFWETPDLCSHCFPSFPATHPIALIQTFFPCSNFQSNLSPNLSRTMAWPSYIRKIKAILQNSLKSLLPNPQHMADIPNSVLRGRNLRAAQGTPGLPPLPCPSLPTISHPRSGFSFFSPPVCFLFNYMIHLYREFSLGLIYLYSFPIFISTDHRQFTLAFTMYLNLSQMTNQPEHGAFGPLYQPL